MCTPRDTHHLCTCRCPSEQQGGAGGPRKVTSVFLSDTVCQTSLVESSLGEMALESHSTGKSCASRGPAGSAPLRGEREDGNLMWAQEGRAWNRYQQDRTRHGCPGRTGSPITPLVILALLDPSRCHSPWEAAAAEGKRGGEREELLS